MARVLILGSEDRQDYNRLVLIPDSMTFLEADKEAEAAINSAIEANRDGYCWDEDIQPALEAKGFVIPEWAHGPNWDTRS